MGVGGSAAVAEAAVLRCCTPTAIRGTRPTGRRRRGVILSFPSPRQCWAWMPKEACTFWSSSGIARPVRWWLRSSITVPGSRNSPTSRYATSTPPASAPEGGRRSWTRRLPCGSGPADDRAPSCGHLPPCRGDSGEGRGGSSRVDPPRHLGTCCATRGGTVAHGLLRQPELRLQAPYPLHDRRGLPPLRHRSSPPRRLT